MNYVFEYTDGSKDIRWFDTVAQARDFAAMEGDHLLEWYPDV